MALFPNVQRPSARRIGGVLFRTIEQQGATILYLTNETQPELFGVDWLEASSVRSRDL